MPALSAGQLHNLFNVQFFKIPHERTFRRPKCFYTLCRIKIAVHSILMVIRNDFPVFLNDIRLTAKYIFHGQYSVSTVLKHISDFHSLGAIGNGNNKNIFAAVNPIQWEYLYGFTPLLLESQNPAISILFSCNTSAIFIPL